MNTYPAAGPSQARLDAEELIAASQKATGLTDFGETDPRESLQQLTRSLNEEACLTEAGIAGKRGSLIRVLSNRLLLQDAFARNPRIADEKIVKPIVILGLPRSGTTKLHRMIAADPQMQKLPLWKLLYPVRALAPGPGTDVENRIAAADAFVNAIRTNNPEQYAGHPMLALAPLPRCTVSVRVAGS
jgi:Sulfotransferase family